MNIIQQHPVLFWFILWLIGAVLAWGRVWAQKEAFKDLPDSQDGASIIAYIAYILLSWVGFFFVIVFWEKGDKFFKWLPVLLLLFCVGCDSAAYDLIDKEAKADTANTLRMINYRYALPSVYIYDGCEYIVVGAGTDRMMSHKGNCKNPIHRLSLDSTKNSLR